MFVMKRLENVAENVKLGDSKAERLSILREHLRKTVLPNEFQLPLNPHIKARTLCLSCSLSLTLSSLFVSVSVCLSLSFSSLS
jgi:hypothetical protein